MTLSKVLMTTLAVAAPLATLAKSGGLEKAGGCPSTFKVCVSGHEMYYGATEPGVGMEYKEKPGGILLGKDGNGWMCELEEYAGGFDGFPSPEVDDGHEKDLDEAVKKMLPHGKHVQDCFLKALVTTGKPVDMDYPRDEDKADNGARMENIYKLNHACTSLLQFDEQPECSAGSSTTSLEPSETSHSKDSERPKSSSSFSSTFPLESPEMEANDDEVELPEFAMGPESSDSPTQDEDFEEYDEDELAEPYGYENSGDNDVETDSNTETENLEDSVDGDKGTVDTEDQEEPVQEDGDEEEAYGPQADKPEHEEEEKGKRGGSDETDEPEDDDVYMELRPKHKV